MVAKPEVKSAKSWLKPLVWIMLVCCAIALWFYVDGPLPFNHDAWVHDRNKRHRMYGNWQYLVGKPQKDICDMLGKPDRGSEYEWVYYMGNDKDPDWWKTIIEFDKNKKVEAVDVDRID